ncbi:MAG: transporter [Flavobacteriaceae bacterium]|nr:MAG: transporter [Flavobacteriaceae bacterium]
MRTKLLVVAAFILCLNLNAQTKKWTIYGCIDYALENNISLQQQVLNSELAQEDINSAKGSFLPNVNGSASQSWNFGASINANNVRVSRDFRGNSFALNTGVTLFDGMRNVNNLERARLGLESTNLQKDIIQDDITINILTRYIDILAQKENLKIALDQVSITQKQIEQIQEFVDAGVRAKADLLDVKAQLAKDEEQVVNAESNVELALLSLTELLQISYKGFDIQDVELNISSVSLLYDDADEIFAKAEETRAEIKKAKLDLESSSLDIDIAKGAYYPTLNLGAGLNTFYQHAQGSDDVRPILDPNDPNNIILIPNGFGQQLSDNLGYNVGFNLNIPIFNRMQTKSNVDRRIINQKRAENNLAQQKQDLYSTVVRVYNSARTSLNQYRASEASVTAQDEAFRNAQESFDLGVMTSFEFEQVRTRLLNAQAAFINAKYNFVFRTKALEYYTGVPITIN